MALQLVLYLSLLAAVCANPIDKPYLGVRVPQLGARIVGGNSTRPGEFPHQVSLQRVNGLGKSHFCGGSILNESWILTAAHCPEAISGAIYVKAGKYSLKTVEKYEQVVKVNKSFIHPEYPGGVAPFDIALLKLDTPLTFTEFVQPVDLPKRDSDFEGDVVLSGWGSVYMIGPITVMPDTLQKADLPLVDIDTCKEAIETLIGPSPVADTNVCTGPLTGGVSACSGDSGGPLVKLVDGKPVQVGVVSWGIMPCGTSGAPSVYTKVSSYTNWIETTIAEN